MSGCSSKPLAPAPSLLLLLTLLSALLICRFVLEDEKAESSDSGFLDYRTGLVDFGRGFSIKLGLDSKYFHEKEGYKHFDKRYFDKKAAINATYRRIKQKQMFVSFDGFCRASNIDYWLAHGTLLGYYWGQKSLGWDDDLDVQTSLQGLYKLNSHNQEKVGSYLVDVNYNFKYREFQKANRIDVRYIDTTTGLFIDITALAPTLKNSSILACKSPHYYKAFDIFPLHDAVFEGISTFRPHNLKVILEDEYGDESLTRTVFNGHMFNNTTKTWDPLPKTQGDKGSSNRSISSRRSRSKGIRRSRRMSIS